MCGIFLVINKKTKHIDQKQFLKASNSHENRGPDHTFSYQSHEFNLSYKILSFSRSDNRNIDDREFFSRDGTSLIALNGEIYNWKSLSKEYFGAENHFRSDAEFLANFLREKGPETVLRRIVGMYAVIFYDIANKKLIYFRDISGEKFFYKLEDDNVIIISSTIRAILEYVGNLQLNKKSLRQYLFTRHMLTLGDTTYENIKLVKKGSAHVIDTTTFRETALDNVSLNELIDERIYNEFQKMDELELQEAVSDCLAEASRDFARDKNPLMCVVSGGVDSTLAADMLKTTNETKNIKGLGIVFRGKDETLDEFLRMKESWRDWVQPLDVTREMYQAALTKSYEITRTPLPTHNFPSQYLLAKSAKQSGFSILISGDGADELFGGYAAYLNLDYASGAREYCPSPYSGVVDSEILDFNQNDSEDMEHLAEGWRRSLEAYHFLKGEKRVQAAMMLSDLAYQVESVGLSNADLMNSENSVEGRSFYMHHKILKIALNLPIRARIDREKYGEEGLKVILKKEFARRIGFKALPKVGYAGFPNEAAECLLRDSKYSFTSDLFCRPLKKMYPHLSSSSKWKVNNLELFLQTL